MSWSNVTGDTGSWGAVSDSTSLTWTSATTHDTRPGFNDSFFVLLGGVSRSDYALGRNLAPHVRDPDAAGDASSRGPAAHVDDATPIAVSDEGDAFI